MLSAYHAINLVHMNHGERQFSKKIVNEDLKFVLSCILDRSVDSIQASTASWAAYPVTVPSA